MNTAHTILHHVRSKRRHIITISRYAALATGITLLGAVLIPLIVISILKYSNSTSLPYLHGEFPITVDPRTRTIREDPKIEALLEGPNSPLEARAGGTDSLWNMIQYSAEMIARTGWYQNLAAVTAANDHIVTITPGMRKEQVAMAFSRELSWNSIDRQQFITPDKASKLPLAEGSFSPGAYIIGKNTTPQTVQALVNQRFTEQVLSRYGTSTAAIVPLNQALTIASIIQRETIGNDDMRLISGIIWNRLFANMNLQVDATLQYAKANTAAAIEWWPDVLPSDKYIRSPYNTYQNPGLPPGPIANPSVGAIIAALNPLKTSCLFYFNDTKGEFHCSVTYAEHVKLLKQYYGEGR